MKKIILLVFALFLTTGLFAQKRMEWGIKGGLNLTTLTKLDNANMKPSIYVGALAEFQVWDFITIQPEVVYSRQGYKYSGTWGNVNGDFWARLNYLNIPVMAKFYVWNRLSVDVGPQFGFMLNSRMRQKVNGDKTIHDLDGMKTFDFSFPVGLSWRFIDRMDASIRYNIGCTDVADDGNFKNSVLQIGVSYRF